MDETKKATSLLTNHVVPLFQDHYNFIGCGPALTYVIGPDLCKKIALENLPEIFSFNCIGTKPFTLRHGPRYSPKERKLVIEIEFFERAILRKLNLLVFEIPLVAEDLQGVLVQRRPCRRQFLPTGDQCNYGEQERVAGKGPKLWPLIHRSDEMLVPLRGPFRIGFERELEPSATELLDLLQVEIVQRHDREVIGALEKRTMIEASDTGSHDHTRWKVRSGKTCDRICDIFAPLWVNDLIEPVKDH